ncbi:class I SAM-dependent methyltransferase [Vibrio lentus]|nr:class I SAM-dependent methyltransferase [Vibrio lentus]
MKHATSVSFHGYDIFASREASKKRRPYELVIIDPPSFQKGSFALTKDYKIFTSFAELQRRRRVK